MPNPTLAPSALIDAAEFARMLSVSKPTIWRLLSAQKIPEPIRLTSQCLRWRRDSVLVWVASGCLTLADQPSTMHGSQFARTEGSRSNEQG